MGVHGEICDLKALQFQITAGVMHTELTLLPILLHLLVSALSPDHPARQRMLGRLDKAKGQEKITVGYQYFSELLLDVFEDIVPFLDEVVLIHQSSLIATACFVRQMHFMHDHL